MKAKATMKQILFVVCALFLWAFLLFENVFIAVKADETPIEYTDVLDDLKKDETFDINNFPDKADDYSLSVIQIAESVNKELFVYAYQPCHKIKDLTATEIRMSMPEVGVDSTYKDYKLTLLSENGVFDKYKVEGVTVKTDSVRYYNIVQLARPWDSKIDKEAGNDNTISTVPYEVSELWKAETKNKTVLYSCEKTETVKVVGKVVGYIQYRDGLSFDWFFSDNFTDSHFVAFSIDRDLAKLVTAQVSFIKQDYVRQMGWHDILTLKDAVPDESNPSADDEEVSNLGTGLWGKRYSWSRIQALSTFLKENENNEDMNFTDGTLETLKEINSNGNSSWVLRFYETSVKETTYSGYLQLDGTLVSNVTIISLTFQDSRGTYTLGVVDNKQTGSTAPSGTADDGADDMWEKFIQEFKAIIKDVLSILIMIGLAIVAGGIFVGICLLSFYCKPLFGLIWKIVTAPFRFIKRLFTRGKKK